MNPEGVGGIDNLMVSLGEKIGSRGDWRRRRGRGGIWTLTVAMAAFGCKMRRMSAAPQEFVVGKKKTLQRVASHRRRHQRTSTKKENVVEKERPLTGKIINFFLILN